MKEMITDVENSSGALAPWPGNLRSSLATMDDLGKIKDVRDKAEAVRQYAKSAARGLEMQNDAAEVKLRAERRAGAILATMRMRGGDRKSNARRTGVTLEELGISQNQSTRWQLLAKRPERDFEAHLQLQRQRGC
ncbi:hypothetical protein [Planctomycetes bacterium TBK1r]|uniref:Uncharacterized protein n=1 Tax=Stieleria magnilauensis TaxID=2527963 RepID=A0ABX5XUY6_9BACT|nr:hypothetical protein TBK1r_48540 [Planctomycetes bacterium TBK1r]